MSECLYYKAICKRFPTVIGAQNLKLGSYVYDFSRHYAWCEIGFVQQGRIREYRGDREWCHEAGCIYTFATPAPLRHYSEDADHVEVILQMRIQEWQPVTREEILLWDPKPGEFLLKNQISDPALCRTLEPMIKQAVEIYNSHSPIREQQTISVILDILTRISAHVIHEVTVGNSGPSPRDSEYCRRACAYIRSHLAKKLTAEDIARHTGISYSRLSHVFHRTMGMTLVEYNNREKIRRVQELLVDDRLTPEEAGNAVGVEDVKYLRRIFRKYAGLTITQYLKLHE